MNSVPQIHLKKGKAGSAIGRHPWLMSQAIDHIDGAPAPGDEIEVRDEKGFLAWGLWNPKSHIRARLYSWKESERITPDLWRKLLVRAIELRYDILKLRTEKTVCRLVFSEGDGLSGLIVDQYDQWLVAQITSLGLARRREEIMQILAELTRAKGIYLRGDSPVLKQEGLEIQNECVMGLVPTNPVEVVENGVRFLVDLEMGQKTGFYSDQRENRKKISAYASGVRVLDLCTYTGAFALNLAKLGATEIVAVDSSEAAIERAKANSKLNDFTQINFLCADVFDFLHSEASGKKFDLIVLDPPRFAPSKGDRERALKSYFKLNEAALKLLCPNGIFLTCSCSHQIGRDDFTNMFRSVVRRSQRVAQILDQGSQGPDHPVSSACPETMYLKSIISRVE